MKTDLSTRIDMAIAFLKKERIIKFQKEVAEKMGVDVNTVSRAKNGGEYNAESFAMRFNAAFDFMFSNEWLLHGNGEMIAPKTTEHPSIINPTGTSHHNIVTSPPSRGEQSIPVWADSLIHLVSTNTAVIESLRKDNATLLQEIAELRAVVISLRSSLLSIHHPVIYDEGTSALPAAAEKI